MNRRQFITWTANGLAVTALAKSGFAQACDTTTTDLYGLGPYYAPDAPMRSILYDGAIAGKPLHISGRLGSCTLPSQTQIEVWHADSQGCYSPQQECQEIAEANRPFHLRGIIQPDANGLYAFKTIIPGRYLNGGTYRPSHIHFRISIPGKNQAPDWQLITQLYFAGDPYIAEDYAAGDAGANNRIISLSESDTGGANGTFHIILPEAAVTGISNRNQKNFHASSFDGWVQILNHQCQLHFPRLQSATHLQIQIENVKGQSVFFAKPNQLPIVLDVATWPRGRYQVMARGRFGNRDLQETMTFLV